MGISERSPRGCALLVLLETSSLPFRCHFLGWDSTKKTRFVDPYEAKLAEQTAKNNKVIRPLL